MRGTQFCKIRYFWVLFRIGSSAGVNKGVLYRESHSQVWNRAEQGDRTFGGFRGGKAVGEGGLAGARVRRRSHRGGAGRLIFLLGKARLRVIGCGVGCSLLPGRPHGGIGLGGRRGGFLPEETARRSGMKFSMAMIMAMALTCPVMLPRVISGLRLAISQRRSSTCSRSRLRRCCPSTARPTASRGRRDRSALAGRFVARRRRGARACRRGHGVWIWCRRQSRG